MKTVLLILLWVAPVFAADRWIDYSEVRADKTLHFQGRFDGRDWVVEKESGDIGRDFFLEVSSPLQSQRTFRCRDLPEFSVSQEWSPIPEQPHAYRVTLQSVLNEEVIPLNEEESRQNEMLRGFGLRSVALKGEGRVLLNDGETAVLAEEITLLGELTFAEHRESLRVDFAAATLEEEVKP